MSTSNFREVDDPRNRPKVTCHAYLVGHDKSDLVFGVLARDVTEAAMAYVARVVHGGLEPYGIARTALDSPKGLMAVWVKDRAQSQGRVLTNVSPGGLKRWLDEDPLIRPKVLQAAIESMELIPEIY